MIKIYCLIDPRTKAPFYVGSTTVLLRERLNAHVSEASIWQPNFRGIRAKKLSLIKDIKAYRMRPQIKCLLIVNKEKASEVEAKFYAHFTNLGFELLQAPHRFMRSGDRNPGKIK